MDLALGRHFSTLEEADICIKQYCKERYFTINKDTSKTVGQYNKKVKGEFQISAPDAAFHSLRFICKHYGFQKKSEAEKKTGKRPNRPLLKTGCPFAITVVIRRDGSGYDVKPFGTEHVGHEVSLDLYNKYAAVRRPPEQTLQTAKDLLASGVGLTLVAGYFNDKGHVVKSHDVYNLKYSLLQQGEPSKLHEINSLDWVPSSIMGTAEDCKLISLGYQRPDKQKELSKTEQEQSFADENHGKDDDVDASRVNGKTSTKNMAASEAILKIAERISKEKSEEIEKRVDCCGPIRENKTSSSTRADADKKIFAKKKTIVDDVRNERDEKSVGRATTGRKDSSENGVAAKVMVLDEVEGTFFEVDPAKVVFVRAEEEQEEERKVETETSRASDPTARTMVVGRPSPPNSGASSRTEKWKNLTIAFEMIGSAMFLRIGGDGASSLKVWDTNLAKEKTSFETNVVDILPKPKPDDVAPKPKLISEKKSRTKPGKGGGGGTVLATTVYRSMASSLQDIGTSLVRQEVFRDLVDVQEAKAELDGLDETDRKRLDRLKGYYDDLRRKNRYLAAPRRRCRCGCRFGTRQELELHREYGSGWESGRFDCCLCNFATKAFAVFSGHMSREHGRMARLPPPWAAAFACPFCPFEEHRRSTKAKMMRHVATCERNFEIDRNLAERAVDSDIPITAPKSPPSRPTSPPLLPQVPAKVATSVFASSVTSVVTGGAKNQVSPALSSSPESRNLISVPKKTLSPPISVAAVSAVGAAGAGFFPAEPSVGPLGFEICETCGAYARDPTSLWIRCQRCRRVPKRRRRPSFVSDKGSSDGLEFLLPTKRRQIDEDELSAVGVEDES